MEPASNPAEPVLVIDSTTNTTTANTSGDDTDNPQEKSVDETDQPKTPEMKETINELETKVEELENEIRALKASINPLVAVFLKTEAIANSFDTAPSSDPRATVGLCKILHMVTNHLKSDEKRESSLEHKLMKANNLLNDQKKLKTDLTNMLIELSHSTGLEDILAKLRIVFQLAGVAPGQLFQTPHSEDIHEEKLTKSDDIRGEDEDFTIDDDEATEMDDYTPEQMEDYTPELDNDKDFVLELDNDEDPGLKVEMDSNGETMDTIPTGLGAEREDGTYGSDDADAADTVKRDADSDCSDYQPVKKKLRSAKTKRKPNAYWKQVNCSKCGRRFPDKYRLQVHMRCHSGVKPFVCPVCNHASSIKDNLKSHMQAMHQLSLDGKTVPKKERKDTKCPLCNKTVRLYSLKAHMKTHSTCTEERYHCNLCSLPFANSNSLKQHKKTHYAEKPWICTVCGHATAIKDNLKSHMRAMHGQTLDGKEIEKKEKKDVTCPVCNKTVRLYSLKVHLQSHTDSSQKSYKCDICPATFAKKHLLTNHKKTHTGEKRFVCTVCGHACTLKDQLKNHMQAVHGLSLDGKQIAKKEKKNTTCPECHKTVRLHGLKDHLRRHSAERPFKCDICPMTFVQKCNLTYHKRRHNKEYNFPCPHCDKKYVYKGELNLHLKRHDAELHKELTCPVCSRVLSDKYIYEAHLLTHSGKKEIKCDHCDQMFHTQRSCREHVKRVHLGVKYQCEECGQLLSSQTGLVNHRRIHTGEKPFMCGVCSSLFRKMDSLKSHIQKQHTKAKIQYRCSKCGDKFKYKNQLHEHLTNCDMPLYVLQENIEEGIENVEEQVVNNDIVPGNETIYVRIQTTESKDNIYENIASSAVNVTPTVGTIYAIVPSTSINVGTQ